jgi:hypothetical protein
MFILGQLYMEEKNRNKNTGLLSHAYSSSLGERDKEKNRRRELTYPPLDSQSYFPK